MQIVGWTARFRFGPGWNGMSMDCRNDVLGLDTIGSTRRNVGLPGPTTHCLEKRKKKKERRKHYLDQKPQPNKGGGRH